MSAKALCIAARPPIEDEHEFLSVMVNALMKALNLSRCPAFYRAAADRGVGFTAGEDLGIWNITQPLIFPNPLNLIHAATGLVQVREVSVPTLLEFVALVRRSARYGQFSFFHEGKYLLKIKHTLYHELHLVKGGFVIPRRGEKMMKWNSIKVPLLSLFDARTMETSRVFCERVAKQVMDEGLVGNAYRKACEATFEQEVCDLCKRGLSSLLDCHDVEAAIETFLRDLKNRGESRRIGKEDDVMYMAVSYRYPQKGGFVEKEWTEVVRMMTAVGKRLGYDRIRIWADKISVTMGKEWMSVGFLPYFIFPVFVHRSARESVNRLWIELEKFAASLGPGMLTEDSTEDDVMQHLVVTRSPTEVVLAFAEVMVSGCMNYDVTYETDRTRMQAWAKRLLAMTETSDVLKAPNTEDVDKYMLEEREDSRHDMSMLCLYDADIARCDPVKKYVRQLNIQRESVWNGVEEIIGRSTVPNSTRVENAVCDAAIVMIGIARGARRANSGGSESTCWLVLYTPRGTMITEIVVWATGDIRNGEVLRCKRVDQSQYREKGLLKDWFLERQSELGHDVDVELVPYREIRWT